MPNKQLHNKVKEKCIPISVSSAPVPVDKNSNN